MIGAGVAFGAMAVQEGSKLAMFQFVRKLAMRMVTSKTKPEEKAVTGLCYFLVCFSRVDFVSFLLASLYRPQDLFLIHCDRKAPVDLKKFLKNVSSRRENIVLLKSQDYSWAGYSHVEVTLRAIEIALRSKKRWTHCLLLSEQHLALKKPDDIEAYLERRKSVVFMRRAASMVDGELADLENRFGAIYRELPGVGCFAVDLVDRNIASIDDVYHGSNWMILHRDHCKVLRDVEKAGGFERFRHIVHAEETAIHTILAPLENEIEKRDAILVAHPHLTDNHSLVMTEALFKNAVQQDYVFIRKRTDVLSDYVRGFVAANHLDKNIEALGRFKATNKPRRSLRPPSEKHLEACQAFFRTSDLAPVQTNRIDPLVFGSVPKIHLVMSTKAMHEKLSVRVLSENLVDYKVCLVKEKPYGLFDRPYAEDGVLYSTLRARLFDLFGCTDILPSSIENDGFVSLHKGESLERVFSLAAKFLTFAEYHTRITEHKV